MFNRKATRDMLIVVMTATAVVIGMLTTQYTGYQLGFATAKTLVENSAIGVALRTPDDIRTLAGTVTAINSESITLHTTSNNPFDDPSLIDRTVLIASSTAITKFTPKDPKAFQSELAAYTKTKGTPPPAPFTPTTITLSDIKVNDQVLVMTPTNIKSVKIFTASLIQVQTLLVPPTNL